MARTIKTSNQLSGPVGGAKYVTVQSDQNGSIALNRADAGAHLGANNAGETVSKMYISQVIWGASATNTWTVSRGANTVLVLTGSGSLDLQSDGIRLENQIAGSDASQNCVFTLSGGTGSIAIKLAKSSGAQ
jgi:hypothetical protein